MGESTMLQIDEPTLLEKILAKNAVVGICGLGYVGLPLALTFGEKGFPVIGFDIDRRKIDAIAERRELHQAHRRRAHRQGVGGGEAVRGDHGLPQGERRPTR